MRLDEIKKQDVKKLWTYINNTYYVHGETMIAPDEFNIDIEIEGVPYNVRAGINYEGHKKYL